ncbi:MAG: hemin-degrading factor [Candidatus Binatia bacterium]|nr:hemin-degrading factor [Candidatus Binatia bacterium]
MPTLGKEKIPSIQTRYFQLVATRGRVRTLDAANALGVTELDLLDAFPEQVLPLRPHFKDIFLTLEKAGPLLGLTRNRLAVIEREGRYAPFAYSERDALVLGPEIDLRLNLTRFGFGRLVVTPNPLQLRPGVLFFDAWGNALHKVFFIEGTDVQLQDRLRIDFADPEASSVRTAALQIAEEPEQPSLFETAVDSVALREAWAAMRDTHDTFSVLHRFRISRLRALHALGAEWAERARPDALWCLLQHVAASGQPIMIFVGNRGVTQIYKGPIEHVRLAGEWWNVLDEKFNLHVRYTGLGQSWVVRKPVPGGFVTSLETFDNEGNLTVQVFSYREPGRAESSTWRKTVGALTAHR